MKIIIPAAGQGTRLRPHTHTLPKVMLPVAGRPIVGHILAAVAALEPDEIRLVVGYMGERLEAYVDAEFPDLPVRIVWQGEQLGLGHATLRGLEPDPSGPVLVVLGDTVFTVDYARVVDHEDNVLGVRPVPDPERFGIVELDPAGERIVRLVEKPSQPKGNLALVGLYYLQDGAALARSIESLVERDARTRGEYQLTDALQRMIDDGDRFVPFTIDDWYDCGKPETLLATNRALLDLGAATDPVRIETRSAAIVPPVFIGSGCIVENAVVGPHVSMSRGATVRDAVVRDSIIGEGATIVGTVLEGSIVGPRARVAASPKTINLGEGSEWTC